MGVEYPQAERVCKHLSSSSLFEDALDHSTKVNEELEFSPLRLIPTDENVIGNIAAESLSHFIQQVDLENEILIRTLHRSLGIFSEVLVHEGSGRPIWIVSDVEHFSKVQDTHAGGREIHLLPEPYTPRPHLPFREDPIARLINCRLLLRKEDLRTIRDYFLGSSGVRVLICEFIYVLFLNQENLNSSLAKGIVPSIGGQRARFLVSEYRSTADTVPSGHALSNKAQDFSTNGCLGLRLRLQSGQEVITTTTHAFVRLCTSPTPLKIKMAEYYVYMRNKLASFRGAKDGGSEPAIAETRKRRGNSPLGTNVWLAGTNIRVGFRHDLSLISDDSLPELVNAPSGPLLTGWGSYASVLDWGSVFVYRINMAPGRWRNLTGSGVSRSTQVAIAAGAEYLWDRAAVTPGISLLWRSLANADTAQGYSGSVLCLGKPTDATALAVVFQNFETPLKPQHDSRNRKDELKGQKFLWFKAGFLLPAETREAEIQMRYESAIIEPKSLNAATRSSTNNHRRILKNP
ncbi:hypothetical protein MMC31_007697 [Peltigera leucophlebia]|nr:hypothetical protein [Peltigera leucophlebia]